MSNQSLRQASVRAVTGTSGTYEEDWHALFTLAGVQAGVFNERLYAWLNAQLGTTYGTLSDAMRAYAVTQGASSWDQMGTFSPSSFYVDGITALTPSTLAFSGANGTYFDSAGVLQDAASNTPRFDYNRSTLAPRGILIEPARTNSIRNNTAQGGGAGVLPTNWNVAGGAGMTVTYLGTGTEDGIPYFDVRFQGTPGATSSWCIRFELAGVIAATLGQTWTQSAFVRMIAGSTTNLAALALAIQCLDAGTVIVESSNASVLSTVTGSKLSVCRGSGAYTVANANTVSIRSQVTISYTNGLAVDITLRIGLPQLELGAYATSPIKTTSAAVTRSADLPTATLSGIAAPFYAVMEGEVVAPEANAVIYSIHEPATVNIPSSLRVSSGGAWALDTVTSGVTQATLFPSGTTPVAGTIFKTAHAVETNNIRACLNGGTVSTDASATISTLSQIRFGADRGSSNASAFWLRRMRIFEGTPTDAQLQAL